MVTGIEIDELKGKIETGESFVLVNAADNVSVCSMDAIKGTYCIPRNQRIGQLQRENQRLQEMLKNLSPELEESPDE